MNDLFNETDTTSMLAAMEEEKAQTSFKSAYWKPTAEGTTPIRIITPLKQFNEKLFYNKHKIHYVNGRSYFCLNQSLKDKNGKVHEPEECPFCKKSKQIYAVSEKGTEDWNIAGTLRAKDRYVSRIIVRNNKDGQGNDIESTPVFWEFGQKIHEYFFNLIKMNECGNFLSLKEGRDFNLVKKGTGRNTDYSASAISMKQTPIFTDKEKLVKLMEELPKMDYASLVEFVKPEEMEAVLAEMFGGETTTSATTSSAPVYKPVEKDTLDPFGGDSDIAISAPEEEKVDAESGSIDDLLAMI